MVCFCLGEVVGPRLDPDEDCDLGVQAMGVPVSKIMMYTTCGGVRPEACMPVCIDVGTDNKVVTGFSSVHYMC